MDAASLGTDPFQAFARWLEEAKKNSQLQNPNAMALATSTPEGKSSVRMVLLKDFSTEGFVFFTNFESRKGRELIANPHAALCFYWDKLERQVRIEGTVHDLPRNQAEVYFHTRVRGSQCGAWASPQSKKIKDRAALEKAAAEIDEKYPEEIPMPPFWGGFCVKPEIFEFWQQCESRLHDRIVFSRKGKDWDISRLAP